MKKHSFIHILTIKNNGIAKKDVTLHSKIRDVRQPLMADTHYFLRAMMLRTLSVENLKTYDLSPLPSPVERKPEGDGEGRVKAKDFSPLTFWNFNNCIQ